MTFERDPLGRIPAETINGWTVSSTADECLRTYGVRLMRVNGSVWQALPEFGAESSRL